ncbi:MAG: di-heme oxidoredictase family protein [Polyangiales bacterium]
MMTAAQRAQFDEGDALFERPFRASEGLGPVYIRASCAACHAGDGRGPGSVQRLAALDSNGDPLRDAMALLPFGSVVRPEFVAPATRGVIAPEDPRVFRSLRVGPAVFGRGWIEAVQESEVERLAMEQRAAGGAVHGRVARLMDGRLGRFGVKSRVATLREFAADAFRGDMGLTSSLFATEVPNPDGLTDDAHPGIDLTDAQIDAVGFYVSAIAMPARMIPDPSASALFERAQCASCHAPSLATRADYPLAAIAGQRAEIYSDLLLHDMGKSLADGIAEAGAGPRDWRTAPLIGMRFSRTFLHDGRASTVDEAIRAHAGEGSEANDSVRAYEALSQSERDRLVAFVRGL